MNRIRDQFQKETGIDPNYYDDYTYIIWLEKKVLKNDIELADRKFKTNQRIYKALRTVYKVSELPLVKKEIGVGVIKLVGQEWDEWLKNWRTG